MAFRGRPRKRGCRWPRAGVCRERRPLRKEPNRRPFWTRGYRMGHGKRSHAQNLEII